jgi:uncharacterized protein YukE
MSNYNSNSSSHTYVDLNALTDWSSQMSSINSSAMNELDSLMAAVEDLNNYWQGNIATGFTNDSKNLIKKAKDCHIKMNDVPSFLIEVAALKSNE